MSWLRSAVLVVGASIVVVACNSSESSPTPTEVLVASASPTRTVTATPVPPTHTVTPAPAARSFTEDFDGDAPHWVFMQAGAVQKNAAPRVQAGQLRFDIPGPDQWFYALYSDQAYADVRVDAEVEFGPGAAASAALICRYRSDLGWYEFNVHADGAYSLLFGQWLTGGVARYTPLVVSESEGIDAAHNEIGLTCEGNTLTPYVNSVQLPRRLESRYVLAEGQVGVGAASGEAGGALVDFEWITVAAP